MKRSEMIGRLRSFDSIWDIAIIGGGATGLGAAIDAASRGYRTVLLEQHDFAKGTSSRSTKLVHGGVRYLQQGNITLVLEALKERGLLHKNAPHLVHNLPLVVPNYDWWEGPFYGVGLKLYDILAGKQGFGSSRLMSEESVIEKIPTIETEGLRGGVVYFDGQFDDSRLAVNMAQTAADQGGTVLNYMEVISITRTDSMVDGVIARDRETGDEYEIRAKAVVNATGVWADEIRRMDMPGSAGIIRPSQGVHIVLDKSFLPGDSAIMVPHTSDGRVLFAIPWRDRIVVGTTDTPVQEKPFEPEPMPEEIKFLLDHSARYLTKDPEKKDVLSMFAGIRPLVASEGFEDTAAISRDHTIHISGSGLITIAGGKWTTYRKMAEDTIDQAALIGQLEEKPCVTGELHIHGYHQRAHQYSELDFYGSDAAGIQYLMRENAIYSKKIHGNSLTRMVEIIWAVRYEMARTVEDFLSRRTRALLVDARASVESAPVVAEIMAAEMQKEDGWKEEQIKDYETLASKYILSG